MPIILQTKRWTAKPPAGAQINFGHPLARHLSMLMLFNEGAGTPRNLLGNSTLVTETGPPSWHTSTTGLTRSYSPAQNSQFPNGNFLALDRVTILCYRRKTDTTLRSAALFAGTMSTGTTHLAAYPPYSDGIVYWDCGGNAGTNRLTWNGYTASIRPEFWAFRAGYQGMSIWFNKQKVASQATAVTRSANDANYYLNRLDFGANQGDSQEIGLLAIYKTELSDSAIQQWMSDPFGVLSPRRQIRFDSTPTTRAYNYSITLERLF
jgi:hypothetical protein